MVDCIASGKRNEKMANNRLKTGRLFRCRFKAGRLSGAFGMGLREMLPTRHTAPVLRLGTASEAGATFLQTSGGGSVKVTSGYACAGGLSNLSPDILISFRLRNHAPLIGPRPRVAGTAIPPVAPSPGS